MNIQHALAAMTLLSVLGTSTGKKTIIKREDPHEIVPHKPKFRRNAPCHCGSNRKFKNCCGGGDEEQEKLSAELKELGLSEEEIAGIEPTDEEIHAQRDKYETP